MSVLKIGDVALAISGSGNYTGVTHDATLSGNGTSASPLGVIGGAGDTSQCMPKSASGDFYPMTGNPSSFATGGPFQPAGSYAYESSLSSYVPVSASGSFAPSGDYAFNSALTGYLKNSASSTWYPYTGNPSGFLTAHQSLTGYVPKSSIRLYKTFVYYLFLLIPMALLVVKVLKILEIRKNFFIPVVVIAVLNAGLMVAILLLGANDAAFVSAVSAAAPLERLGSMPMELIIHFVSYLGVSIYYLIKEIKGQKAQA